MHLAESGSIDPGTIANLAQYGIVGAILLAILGKKWLVPKWTLDSLADAHERELKAKDDIIAGLRADVVELKAAVAQLTSTYQAQVIPALTEANRLSASYVAELARRKGD